MIIDLNDAFQISPCVARETKFSRNYSTLNTFFSMNVDMGLKLIIINLMFQPFRPILQDVFL